MLVLGVETSCDDTAAAVLLDGRTVLANLVSSQDSVHGPFGGVVPELASRQHVRHILPILDGALKKAGIELKALDGIAVTFGPGLVGSLLVGLSVVKGISFRWGIPYVGVNHLEAHLLAVFLERDGGFCPRGEFAVAEIFGIAKEHGRHLPEVLSSILQVHEC